MLKIAITNQKGGVGKTTSALNIGACMARRGLRVLLVDMDGQQNLSRVFGLKDKMPNILTFIDDERSDFPAHKVGENLYLVPGSKNMHTFDVIANALQPDATGLVVKNRFTSVDLESSLDVIIFDCPPKLDQNTINAMVYAEWVFVPVHPDAFSIDGLEATVEAIKKLSKYSNPALKLGGIFLVKYNQRAILHRNVRESLITAYLDKVLETTTRESISINEAITSGMDVFTYDTNREKVSNGSKDYELLTNEILFVTQEFDSKRITVESTSVEN